MRIAAMFDAGTANSHYRVLLPLSALEARGHRIVWPRVASTSLRAYDVPACDAIVLHRCFRPQHVTFVDRLRSRGVAVVWDNDDDFSSVPKLALTANKRSRRQFEQDFACTVQIARSADLVTAPSQRIAALYAEHGARRTAVLENAVPAGQTGRRRPPHRGLVIGCAGMREHEDDIKRLKIRRALETVMRRHAGVRVVSIGNTFRIAIPGYRHYDHVDIDKMMALEREFDIGIAPLADTDFNRARSNIKLKEYAAAGAMWLASPVGTYRDLGPEQGGLLVADRDWSDTLSALITDDARRAELTARARAWAASQTMERTVGGWDAALRQAVASARTPR